MVCQSDSPPLKFTITHERIHIHQGGIDRRKKRVSVWYSTNEKSAHRHIPAKRSVTGKVDTLFLLLLLRDTYTWAHYPWGAFAQTRVCCCHQCIFLTIRNTRHRSCGPCEQRAKHGRLGSFFRSCTWEAHYINLNLKLSVWYYQPRSWYYCKSSVCMKQTPHSEQIRPDISPTTNVPS